MRAIRSSGSVRGVRSNLYPYRDPLRQFACLHLPSFFLLEPTHETNPIATACNTRSFLELIWLILQQGWVWGSESFSHRKRVTT